MSITTIHRVKNNKICHVHVTCTQLLNVDGFYYIIYNLIKYTYVCMDKSLFQRHYIYLELLLLFNFFIYLKSNQNNSYIFTQYIFLIHLPSLSKACIEGSEFILLQLTSTTSIYYLINNLICCTR